MAVGKSSLVRANQGVKAQKMVDKKVVLENAIVDTEIERLVFKTEKVGGDFVKSVETYGIICPVIAVKDGEALEVIDGAKRLTALKQLGIKTCKVVVVNGDVKTLKKEVKAYSKTVETKNTDNIHEEKFKMISGIKTDLPYWML